MLQQPDDAADHLVHVKGNYFVIALPGERQPLPGKAGHVLNFR